MGNPDTALRPAQPRDEVSAEQFRQLLRQHPAGVVIVTADVAGRPVGLTATSFTSVSLNPPLVSFYIATTSSTWTHLSRADSFSVHLLGEDQADLAARFAAKGVDRFAPPTRWSYGLDGTPALEGVAARLVCRRYDTQLIGDHWLVVGRVVHSAVHDASRPPLLYHRGSFGGFAAL
ncbi:flavin reductase family protein [Thermobifida alba]|uniref:Flavin reductase n=2 Tax=Thermobifida TaxID=83677 RepID=A0A147KII0_THECS|nr:MULTISPECIES: flavin reductase family protein [Thermobifida]KUP97090.1 flavin reductase [Thermobifida cellulosilytica TB100]UPT20406.1 flavin reductase family protein [Thermobifida alba]HLU95214.1 flavin reductase family protein [Thermobifida alba]